MKSEAVNEVQFGQLTSSIVSRPKGIGESRHDWMFSLIQLVDADFKLPQNAPDEVTCTAGESSVSFGCCF